MPMYHFCATMLVKRRTAPFGTVPLKPLCYKVYRLAEVPLQQPVEALAVTRFVLRALLRKSLGVTISVVLLVMCHSSMTEGDFHEQAE